MLERILLTIGFLTVLTSVFYPSENVSAAGDETTTCVLPGDEELNVLIEEYNEYHEFLMGYVEFNNGTYFFDENRALSDEISNFDIEAGKHLVGLKNQESQYGDKAVFEEAKEFEDDLVSTYAWYRYGHYCGPGNDSGVSPNDPVDYTCMLHDNCYDIVGWGSCGCDRDLVSRMTVHAADYSLPSFSRTFAGGAAAHFAARIAQGLCVN